MDEPQDGGHLRSGLVPRLARFLKKVKAKKAMTSHNATDDQELSLEGERPNTTAALLLLEKPPPPQAEC
jgi:hypothetical protein